MNRQELLWFLLLVATGLAIASLVISPVQQHRLLVHNLSGGESNSKVAMAAGCAVATAVGGPATQCPVRAARRVSAVLAISKRFHQRNVR